MISGTVFPALRNFLTFRIVSATRRGLRPNLHTSISRFGDAIHLTFMADVVLEFGYQRQDAHNELAGARGRVDGWVVHHLEGNPLLGELGDDAIKIRRRAR